MKHFVLTHLRTSHSPSSSMNIVKHLFAATAAIFCAITFAACDGNRPSLFDALIPPQPAVLPCPVAPAAHFRPDSLRPDSLRADSTFCGVVPDTAVFNPLAKMPLASLTETVNPLLDANGCVPRLGRAVDGKLICLTFDDGPNTKTTPIVLDVLKRYGAHATFFCIGKNITDKTRHLVQRAADEGNEIASHTWSHPFLSRISHSKRTEEMAKTAEAIHDAVGYYPNLYRPPYLDCNTKVLADISLPAISGSASDDWMKDMTPDMITAKVLSTAKPNAIYVMHDFIGNPRTPVALETLIPALQEQGYTLVTVSDLFASLGVIPEPHALYTCGEHVAKRANSSKSKSEKSKKSDKQDKSDKHDKSKSDKSKKSKHDDSKHDKKGKSKSKHKD